MKKIILLSTLFVFSLGYSQTLLQGFESGGVNGGPFGGMPVPVVETGAGSNTSQVLKIVTDTGQQPWQGINLFLSPSTDLTVNKTLTIDVLSSTPITFLVKVNVGGPEAAAPVTHNGDGTWQTLSFTFNTSLDGKAANPTGTYSGFVIHPYWEVGRTEFFTPTVVPKPARTFYVDNIREPAPVGPPLNDVTGDVYINDGTFTAGDFTTAAGQDIATNDGSAAEPFATLDYALARSTQVPGDVIYIDAGAYSWPTTHALTDSGTLANPITIQGKGNDETNITTTAASTTSAGLHFTTGEHWVVKDLNWTATAARAVWVANVDGIILDNCTINMTSTSNQLQSIIIGTAGGELTIKNSRLTRSNTTFHMVEVVEGTTLIMQDNTVSFSALAAVGTATSVQIRTNASSLFIIERNKFVNGGYGIGNVVGSAGPVNANSIIKNNFFNSFWGIVTTIVQGLTVHNNSFYTNGESIYGIAAGSLTNWDIRNNILYTYGNTRACVMSGSATSHPAIMDYNHYYSPNTGAARQGSTSGPILSFIAWQGAAGGPWEANGQGGNAASFDPLYVDAANGDLHLQPGSPAIGAGVDVGIADDIDGNARPLSGTFDIGADEFNVASCSTVLGSTSATCDEPLGPGATDDTYTATVDFSNGLNGNVYVVAASSGTVGGDDPNLVASGTITVTGITEGTGVTVTVDDTADGGLCSLSTMITSPSCVPPVILDLLEDFEGTTDFTPKESLGAANVVVDPLDPMNTVGEIISDAGGVSWQNAVLVMQDNYMDLSTVIVVEVDVYSTQSFTMFAKLENLITPGPTVSGAQENYVTGSGWQTLTFTFDTSVDNLGFANGQYSQIGFFPNWAGNDSGNNGDNDDWNDPLNFTVYVDNIRAVQGDALPIIPVNYVYNNGWAPSDPTGVSGALDNFNVIGGDLVVDADLECGQLTIQPGASMTIDTGVTMTTNETTCFSQSALFSSLIVNGSITGTVNYHRFTNIVGVNDLASPPLSGQTFGSFATNPGNGNLAFQGTERAYAPYNTVAGEYQNYDVVANAGTEMTSGVGYRAATIDGNRLIYTGTPVSGDVLDVPITDAVAGKAWNLIGNPYSSYMDFDTFFNANLGEFDSAGPFQAIYGYDGSATNGWVVWNLATIADGAVTELIAPGQGFFVKSQAGGGLVDYTASMKRTGSSDDFIQGRNASPLDVALNKLSLTSATNTANTSIYFIEGTTRGLDAGYDAGSYGGAGEAGFLIYTNLVEENEGLDIAIQSLDYNDFNDVVIPVGVKASAGSALTIALENSSYSPIPANVNVYLEDTLENTMTLLNTSDYTFTPATDMFGTGRFFLRYSADTLSLNPNEALNELVIYTNDSSKDIIIKGILTGATTSDLYDVQGRLVLSGTLEQSTLTNTIDVSSISSGVYIIKVSNNNSTKTQKLIIK